MGRLMRGPGLSNSIHVSSGRSPQALTHRASTASQGHGGASSSSTSALGGPEEGTTTEHQNGASLPPDEGNAVLAFHVLEFDDQDEDVFNFGYALDDDDSTAAGAPMLS